MHQYDVIYTSLKNNLQDLVNWRLISIYFFHLHARDLYHMFTIDPVVLLHIYTMNKFYSPAIVSILKFIFKTSGNHIDLSSQAWKYSTLLRKKAPQEPYFLSLSGPSDWQHF